MAVNKTTEINKIVARCRRINWDVEMGNGRQDWMFRINPPNGKRVQIHRSPSDRNWRAAVMAQLDAAGFTEAEQAWIEADKADRRARLEADRVASEAAARRVADKSAKVNRALDNAAGEFAVLPVDINWLLTPSKLPQTRIVLMTPEAAAKALDTINTRNRRKRDERTQFFVEIIRDGDWGATHQGAAIDTNGVLQDGQHRFAAIAEAGHTVPMMVTVGMPPENFRKVDTPLQRTARDAAQMRGEVNVTALTATARILMHLDKYGGDAHVKGAKTRASIDHVDRAIVEWGDELRHAVRDAQRIRKDVKCKIAPLAAAIYKIRHILPEGDPRVAEFLDQLETGIGVSRSHPVWLLRRMFIRTSDTRGRRMTAWETYAYIVKAWNHAARGTQISQLIWRSNEPLPVDPFLPPPIADGAGESS